ncbi:MAG TPA: aminoacetone oxidase family FAD-binding enzyme [Candidatus Faecimonas gallistercoris]|nr:aminoacetone oxidase family FAD-binding enzyme [Candidatus Faecimonas gallistercoris]
MRKVAIIGAGAAGVVCSIYAASNDLEVVLFDKNKRALKKLLATGNGRCNYWNRDQDLSHYHSRNEELISSIITPQVQKEVLPFFESLGIVPNIRNGYYYPFSNQANSIRDILESEALRRGVIFSLATEVLDIYKEKSKFVVSYEDKKEYFDDLVIATGSKASPKTGSTGDGYFFAERFGHSVVTVYPSLVQMITEGNFLNDWAGVRSLCSVSLYENNQLVKKEEGEIQLTNYGVSGICVFNLSRYVSIGIEKKKEMLLKINFMPFLEDMTKEEVWQWFSFRGRNLGLLSLVEFLEGILPYKLLMVILKRSGLSFKRTWNDLEDLEKKQLISMILEFPLSVLGTKDFSHSQVCSGGVPLTEVDCYLESKKVKHLYFIGEVLDVDGDCGGYNLGFAFMSGMIVGKALRGDMK